MVLPLLQQQQLTHTRVHLMRHNLIIYFQWEKVCLPTKSLPRKTYTTIGIWSHEFVRNLLVLNGCVPRFPYRTHTHTLCCKNARVCDLSLHPPNLSCLSLLPVLSMAPQFYRQRTRQAAEQESMPTDWVYRNFFSHTAILMAIVCAQVYFGS